MLPFVFFSLEIVIASLRKPFTLSAPFGLNLTQSRPTCLRARGGEGAGNGSSRGCQECREEVHGARMTTASKRVE